MKKVGEYTVRGKVAHLEEARIILNDGRFDTGFVITRFSVFPKDFTAASDQNILGRLATTDGLPLVRENFWDASDNRQIAWCATDGDGFEAMTPGESAIIDPDNFIVEDLFITCLNGDDGDSNYLIVMDKYDTTDSRGALAMVRNRSQA